MLEAIQNVWLRHSYQTSNSQKGNQRWSKGMKSLKISCSLWLIITRQCQTLNMFYQKNGTWYKTSLLYGKFAKSHHRYLSQRGNSQKDMLVRAELQSGQRPKYGTKVSTVKELQCVGLSILATSYCAYSDPFPTGLLKRPYSFLLGQGNRLKCINPPPHREKQRPKCTNLPPLWESNAKMS